MSTPSREVPIDPRHAAFFIVDVQNYCAHPDGTGSHKLDAQQRHYLLHRLRETVLPNLQLLQSTCRRAQIEIIYAAVENMTRTAATAASITKFRAPSAWRRGARRVRLGYLVTLVTDACKTTSAERHEQSLLGIRGYCRQRTTDELVAEITAPAVRS
jgi:nicotinamidase-related amidase